MSIAPSNTWEEIIAEMGIVGPAKELADNCILEELTGNSCTISVSPYYLYSNYLRY
jgi:hypothetical protein